MAIVPAGPFAFPEIRVPAETVPPNVALMQLIFGKWVSMAVSVAAKLRLADHLAAEPRSVAELAERTQTHEPSLYRLLRALASVGVFAEQPDGRFAQTDMGEFLRTGVPNSLRGIADYGGSDWSWKPWGDLIGSIRTGRTAFDHIFGEPAFDYLGKHPEESAVFNEGMTGFSTAAAQAISQAYDFTAFSTIVDVGGGHGALLMTILESSPNARGIVYDSPAVVAGAMKPLEAAGLACRCEALGGDFFQSVPANADCIIMKHIIHDWDDTRAGQILRNCRSAIQPAGKLVIAEIVIPSGNEPSPGKLLDLEMLVIASGKERTVAEYRELLAGAGFRLTRIVPTQSPVSLVEAIPV